MRLSELRADQKGIILNINIPDVTIKRHLMEMGITKGTKIKVLKLAPMGDPICVELRGYELAIRKNEARYIIVEVMS